MELIRFGLKQLDLTYNTIEDLWNKNQNTNNQFKFLS